MRYYIHRDPNLHLIEILTRIDSRFDSMRLFFLRVLLNSAHITPQHNMEILNYVWTLQDHHSFVVQDIFENIIIANTSINDVHCTLYRLHDILFWFSTRLDRRQCCSAFWFCEDI